MRRADIIASVVALCTTTTRLPALAINPPSEPEAAQQLFELCRDKRPSSSWTLDERRIVDGLIDDIVQSHTPWRKDLARGKWRLAYLQRGIDARNSALALPFTNEQFQIFSQGSVVSAAEILGPTLEVRAAGAWREDSADISTPKRFRADITQGALCGSITMGRAEKANIGRACAPLPLVGETYRVVNAEYVGRKLRISQDLNSGGSRVVQVRVDGFSGR